MFKVFIVLASVSTVLALIGIVNPSWVLMKKHAKNRTRAFLTYAVIAVLFIFAFGLSLPPLELEKPAPSEQVTSSPKEILKNDQLGLVFQQPQKYKSYPVEITGVANMPSQTVGGVTKFQLKPDSSGNGDNLLVFIAGEHQLKPGDKVKVFGTVGIKMTDDMSPEMIGIIADSIDSSTQS